MKKHTIIALLGLVAGIATAGTASFDGIKANSVIIQGNPAITNIVVSGTNYSGGSVTIPPGPKGDTGPAGATSTNTEYIGYTFTSLVQNVSVTTNINSYTTNYNAVDDSKWPTNQPFVSQFVWTNAGVNSWSTNAGLITAIINTNSGSASGGVTNHADLAGILGNGAIHLSVAETNRIPTAYGTNSAACWTGYGTNYYWQPVAVNYQNNLTVTWTHQTNFTYVGVSTQQFVIPNGVPIIQVKAWGGGGGGSTATGGNGGFAAGAFAVNSGDILYMMVAQGGLRAHITNHMVSAWPGGGYVVSNGSSTLQYGANGGGYTLVALNSITNVLLIAGGGGGSGQSTTGPVGGAGGGSTGQSGGLNGMTTAATGGSQIAPGTGGSATSGLNGSDGVGRNGGNATYTVSGYHGGAGGGGYYGGGAGAGIGSVSSGGGGGGSCYGQYVERSNNTADESYSGAWGVGGATTPTDGSSGAVVLRYYYSTP